MSKIAAAFYKKRQMLFRKSIFNVLLFVDLRGKNDFLTEFDRWISHKIEKIGCHSFIFLKGVKIKYGVPRWPPHLGALRFQRHLGRHLGFWHFKVKIKDANLFFQFPKIFIYHIPLKNQFCHTKWTNTRILKINWLV